MQGRLRVRSHPDCIGRSLPKRVSAGLGILDGGCRRYPVTSRWLRTRK